MKKRAKRFSVGLIKSWSKTERDAFFRELSNVEAQILLDDWSFWAHPAQLPPDPAEHDWTTWVFIGGRGSGKTRAGAEWIRALVDDAREPLRIALVAESYAEARMTMIEGVSGLLSIGPIETRPLFLPSLRELRWANGSIAQIFSSEDPDGMRGPQYHAAWSDGWRAIRFARAVSPSMRAVPGCVCSPQIGHGRRARGRCSILPTQASAASLPSLALCGPAIEPIRPKAQHLRTAMTRLRPGRIGRRARR